MHISTNVEPLAYSRRDAATALGICERTLFDLVKAGRIREIKIGRSVRIPKSEIVRFLSESLDESNDDLTTVE
jgi:excisionase family DNA binding protein